MGEGVGWVGAGVGACEDELDKYRTVKIIVFKEDYDRKVMTYRKRKRNRNRNSNSNTTR